MNSYIKDKLSLKLNLHLSKGEKTSGVVTDRLITKILTGFEGYGSYEIVWDKKDLLPLSLKKIPGDFDIRYTGSQYIVMYEGRYNKVLFPAQYIEFNISEYRNQVLKELLK